MENKEKVIVLGLNLNDEPLFNEYLAELKELCRANDYEVVGEVLQNAKKITVGTYVGEGKAEELKNVCAELGVSKIVVNDDLSPTQGRNLNKITDCAIIDRTALILEIFANRAKTKEARMQVEIAMLKYKLPRLVLSSANLAQQVGGVGSKSRGLGEKKIQLDKRVVNKKIDELKAELEQIVVERVNRRKKRTKSEIPSVAVVGYTNAGKSSLLNYMVDHYGQRGAKQVFEKDMLFATLDTSLRRITLKDNKKFIMSDTVGFVSKLPTDLVKAFRSTLEEAIEADLLLHVIDTAHPNYTNQIDVTERTLVSLGIDLSNVIKVFNKIDKSKVEAPNTYNQVYISAKVGTGIESLIDIIKQRLFKDYQQVKMLIPYHLAKIVEELKDTSNIQSIVETEEGYKLSVEVNSTVKEKYSKYIIK
jgi:GTP-binding protein HflX